MNNEEIKPVYVLRTPQMFGRYKKHLIEGKNSSAFFFTSSPIREWKYWRVIKNDFPYDELTKKHHLLTPKRMFGEESEMNNGERKELIRIKKDLADFYDAVIENFVSHRSFKNHYHLHLIRYRKDKNN